MLDHDFYREYNIVNFPCGNTGTQMGGWSQARYQRRVDNARQHPVREVVEVL